MLVFAVFMAVGPDFLFFEVTPWGSVSFFEFTRLGPRVLSVEITPGGQCFCFLHHAWA